MQTLVGQLYCYGYTNAAAAYWDAYQQLVTLNDQGALNVILFFTDGMPNTVTFDVAPDGTDNRLPIKTLATPYHNSALGSDIANKSPCTIAGPIKGVVSFWAGLYLKDAPSFPASKSVDAQMVPGGTNCISTAQFNNPGTVYSDGSPSRAVAGPGFPPILDIAYLPEEDYFRNKNRDGLWRRFTFGTRQSLSEHLSRSVPGQNPRR